MKEKTLWAKQSIIVKAVTTEALKDELVVQLQENSKRIDLELEKLTYQGNKLLLESSLDIRENMALRKKIDDEKREGEVVKSQIGRKIKEVKELELGTLYPIGVIEGLVELKVGDMIWEKINNAEVIIKDGKIEEINS